MIEYESFINQNPVARQAYIQKGEHVWLYNKSKTRRWCNISDRQERLVNGAWEFIDQPKRKGFL
jgi:hypothetical protein